MLSGRRFGVPDKLRPWHDIFALNFSPPAADSIGQVVCERDLRLLANPVGRLSQFAAADGIDAVRTKSFTVRPLAGDEVGDRGRRSVMIALDSVGVYVSGTVTWNTSSGRVVTP